MTRTDALNLGQGLSLEADYLAGRSLALLGKRGAGKTFTCRVLVEEFHKAEVQTVIVDPMGVFWGLRSSANGQRSGLPIPVFGGSHADAPLEPSAGALMADLAVEEGLSMILDLSGFTSRTQERTFAGAYFDRLYRANKHLLHLVVDEADLFAPQKPKAQDAPLLAITENIVRRGRNKGLGITLASQRAAVVNKDILTQVDVLAAMRVTAPQDRNAIRDWVQGQGDETKWEEIAPSLPSLSDGQAWWWAPEQGLLKRAQVRRARTFDSSPTRQRGHSARPPNADVDLSAISAKVAATVERAKGKDPKALQRELVRLKAENARLAADREVEQVEIPVIPAKTAQGLASARQQAAKIIAGLEALGAQVTELHTAGQRIDEVLEAASSARTRYRPGQCLRRPRLPNRAPSRCRPGRTDRRCAEGRR